jgi:hypothetical protein
LPKAYFRSKYNKLKTYEQKCNQEELNDRFSYYLRLSGDFDLPESAIRVKDFKRSKGTDYYLDLKEFLHYLSPETKITYRFGDDTHENPFPTLLKAREITSGYTNSVLFKLNKNRHFKWVDDPNEFEDKTDLMVWRGGAYKPLRRSFVEKFYDHKLCNVGQTNKPIENVPWQKDPLSIDEHLKYKFIFCPEGNDVATNLKWAMSSNSLCLMPKPRCETWYMEGRLEAGVHYVDVKDDFSDLEEKIIYYTQNTKEAKEIIRNAHKHVARFQNKEMEDLLCLKVLEEYTRLSGQK